MPVRGRWTPYALGLVFCAAYATLSVRRFARFETPSWDNAIFEQAIRAYAHLSAPVVDIKGPGFNILGDHFSPIIAVLAPVYRLLPHAQTLLVAQAVLVAASLVPVTRLAMRRIGTSAGVAVGVAYGLSFGIASAIAADFHEVAFAAPLLAFAGEAFVRRRWHAVLGWSLPLLLVKEDLGLTVAVIGAVVALRGARRTGAVLAGAGVLGFVLTLLVVIPAFNPSGTYDYLGVLGAGGGGGPGPVETFLRGWDTKAYTLLLTFGATGFLALRSPWALVTVPTLVWRFVGDNPYYWGTDWHYSLVLMPVVFVALVDAVDRGSRWAWLRRYATHVPAVAAAVALVVCTRFPLSELAKPVTYQASARASAAHEVLDRIPAGASVETDIGLITHLTSDRRVYWTGTVGSAVPEYVLVDAQAGWGTVPDVVSFAEHQHPGTTYTRVFDSDGYQLAKRSR